MPALESAARRSELRTDHLEILWDIDVGARERAAELGLELDRIESLNDDPAFIRGLALVVRDALLPSPE